MRMRSSTGAATRAVRSDIDRKPANRARKRERRRRARRAARARDRRAPRRRAVSAAGSHSAGSRSAARLSATPPMAATGSHRKNRRSSTSRASAPAKAARQSGAHAAARESPRPPPERPRAPKLTCAYVSTVPGREESGAPATARLFTAPASRSAGSIARAKALAPSSRSRIAIKALLSSTIMARSDRP